MGRRFLRSHSEHLPTVRLSIIYFKNLIFSSSIGPRINSFCEAQIPTIDNFNHTRILNPNYCIQKILLAITTANMCIIAFVAVDS